MANTFKTLFQNLDPKHRSEIFIFNKKKFKIDIVHTNGEPSGFNYKCCLSIMKNDGTWQHIADNYEIGCNYRNLYFSNDDQAIVAVNNVCVNAFRDYVKAVYA